MKYLKYQAEIDRNKLSVFRQGILLWYREHGRDLPWRRTRDPYKILVSEIMLHQTTVKTVIPIYEAFVARFPTLATLAAGPLDDVKAITDPLGYKRRGQWLHDIAVTVATIHQGQFPSTLEALLALPGIGRYTAGAIMSFAFEMDAPILDTNVKRVLGRYFGIDYRDSTAETQHHLWALADGVLPPGQGSEFNQALMDLGAMVCASRRPLCTICPLVTDCRVFGDDDAHAAAEERLVYRVTPRPREV